MIRVNLYTQNGIVWRVKLKGHAGYGAHGEDILCAAVSVLVENTINSIEKFTDEKMKIKQRAKSGFIDCVFPNRKKGICEKESELLIRAMIFGLMQIRDKYGEEYITVAIND